MALLAHAAHITLGLGGPANDGFFNNVVYNVVMYAAAAAVALRALSLAQDRVAWLVIAAGMALWATGDLYFTLVLSDLPVQPYPSWADAMYLAFAPCCYAGLALLVRSRLRGLRVSVWLDGIITGTAAASVGAALLVGPIMSVTGATTAVVATNLAYPILDLLLLTMAVAVLGARGWRPGSTWSLLAGSFVVSALADSIYLYQAANGTYVEGTSLDLLWPASVVLIAFAAWTPQRTSVAPRLEGWRLLVVPILGITAVVAELFYDHGETDVSLPARLLAGVALLLAALRVTLAFRESLRDAQRNERLALTDELTSLGNRRMLLRDLDTAVIDATEGDPRLLMMFDLNGFKQYNDAFGHPAGDALLSRLAGKLAASVAPYGRAYRMGGDEFCVLARPGGTPIATIVEIAATALTDEGPGFTISAANGTAQLPAEARVGSEALQIADRRLYHEKDGRPSSVKRQLRGVLLQAIQEREPDLLRHGEGVAEMAAAIGRRLGLDAEELDVLIRAAELHDIGKMAVPDAILEKPGPLDAAELEFMRRHTVLGQRILMAASAMVPVAALVRSSHERWDGGGYPDGLGGCDIPLGARIIFVCDAYEAITSDRAYRKGASHEHAISELRAGAGTQFDPDVVDVFCDVIPEIDCWTTSAVPSNGYPSSPLRG